MFSKPDPWCTLSSHRPGTAASWTSRPRTTRWRTTHTGRGKMDSANQKLRNFGLDQSEGEKFWTWPIRGWAIFFFNLTNQKFRKFGLDQSEIEEIWTWPIRDWANLFDLTNQKFSKFGLFTNQRLRKFGLDQSEVEEF